MSKNDDDDAIRSINEVERFLMDLMHLKCNEDKDFDIPYDSMPYGEALLRWRKTKKDPRAMFSTDDPTVLYFRKELMDKFGLEILTHDQAEERKKNTNIYKTMKITGFPSVTKLLN